MSRDEFRAIRHRLGLSQSQLAVVLGWRSPLTVSNYERQSKPRRIPFHVALLMQAMDEGFRPETWKDLKPPAGMG